jgi:hypothetical protein
MLPGPKGEPLPWRVASMCRVVAVRSRARRGDEAVRSHLSDPPMERDTVEPPMLGADPDGSAYARRAGVEPARACEPSIGEPAELADRAGLLAGKTPFPLAAWGRAPGNSEAVAGDGEASEVRRRFLVGVAGVAPGVRMVSCSSSWAVVTHSMRATQNRTSNASSAHRSWATVARSMMGQYAM